MPELTLKNPVGPFFSSQRIWLFFSLALLFPLIPGLWAKGGEGAVLLVILATSALASDRLSALIRRKPWKVDAGLVFQTLLLLAFLPAGIPYWAVAAGGILLVIFRTVLGNPAWLHPVLAVWLLLNLSLSPGEVGAAAQGERTPLENVKTRLLQEGPPPQGAMEASGIQRTETDQKGADWLNNQVFGLFNVNLPGGYLDLMFGRAGGSLGGAAGFFILLSSILLLGFRLISWEIPLGLFLSHGFLMAVFGGLPFQGGYFSGDVLFYTLSGSLLLGMFFAATDYSTAPLGREGKLIYGLLCGTFIALFRLATWEADGTVLGLVLMNLLFPLFEKRKKTLNP